MDVTLALFDANGSPLGDPLAVGYRFGLFFSGRVTPDIEKL